MNTDLHKYSHNPMMPIYRKFNDDIFVGCLVIMKNDLTSFIKEYNVPPLRPPCTASIMSSPCKNTFFLHNLGRSFHI